MRCIYCDSETQVTNSRLQRRTNQVWRRRKCQNCSATFTTHEGAMYDAAWRVKLPTGKLQPFNKNKLFLSLYKSLGHRQSALDDASALLDTIMGRLLSEASNGILEPAQIISTSSGVLKRFDQAAAISYQAFHPKKS